MGTRSLTTFIDEFTGKEIVVLYGQMDGYPSGHGRELFRVFGNHRIGNGIPLGSRGDMDFANGMSCFSAQVVAHFKEDVGCFYLYPAGTRGLGEEYIYTFYLKDVLRLRLTNGENKTLYDGKFSEFGLAISSID